MAIKNFRDYRMVLFIPKETTWPLESIGTAIIERSPISLRGYRFYKSTGLITRTDQYDNFVDGDLVLFADYESVFNVIDQHLIDARIRYHRGPLLYDDDSGFQVQYYKTIKMRSRKRKQYKSNRRVFNSNA